MFLKGSVSGNVSYGLLVDGSIHKVPAERKDLAPSLGKNLVLR